MSRKSKKENQKTNTVAVSEDAHRLLRVHCAQHGVRIGVVATAAVVEYLARHGRGGGG